MTEKSEALRLAKSEALRLADELQAISKNPWAKPWERFLEAAAELRRLHAENERLHQINWSHEVKLSVRGYEIQIEDLRAVNAELLEALKLALYAHGVVLLSDPPQEAWKVYGVEQKARAAIAKAEGGQT